MRRFTAFVTVSAMTLLGFVAVGSPAQGSIVLGTNGKIAFGFGDAFTINPDGSQEHQVGAAGSTVCTAWSPDSNKILCNVFGDNGPQPATANPDGSDFTFLNPNLPLDLFCIFWLPNGARLLCHSEGIPHRADAGLYTVRSSDAGDLVRVTATPRGFYDIGYGYSPDASRILFARFDFATNGGTLHSVKPDGSNRLRLSPPGLRVYDPQFFDLVGADWSPDGSHVTFAAQTASRGHEFKTAVYVEKANGTSLRQITPTSVGATSAQWSPNGRRIAFTSCCDTPEAWIVRPDGTGLREVTHPIHGAFSLTPVWSPDSTKLLFNRVNRRGMTSLWTANTDGSGLSKLADTAGPTGYTWGNAPKS